ncbi:hypothetical protein CLAFUW4_14192 [Fulvia fulva]|uniref:Uncharacterized protein n=1 Tax=Passalora fulva TaxID=5499 RepID=A0A9Q8PLP7_PASFU|nr:uncharacterized protein CLAFUR5_14024 [Fulvia fulva]KAK4610179.1 hypothetical protein CLAFUR4_14195 [Fulvia fulva]KAK4611379.1 hypothetical protein CLAFUR0_14199 [Fulvia fulva]UJO24725.1 hypothetical protein CLAFUR5_14024 [Fulvia fulva]WPV21798.1 hypothetical protein CLAFUW4_14192 [Fulvia fulva]WPV37331.1 hypothetical protein CLAFUW7_14203 [Fulvia fulva]
MATTDKAPPKTCHFLKLPTELRLNIYEDVIFDFDIPQSNCPTYADTTTQYLLPVLNTCTQIRTEAAKAYHARMQQILDGALSDLTDAVEEYEETGAAHHASSVYRFQLIDMAREKERKPRAHYKMVTLVVCGEMCMARSDMDGEGTSVLKGEGAKDVFGDCYVVSGIRQTYGGDAGGKT